MPASNRFHLRATRAWRGSSPRFSSWSSLLPALATALALAVSVAQAAPIADPANDFLPTYIGGKGGDLDVVGADVTLVAGTTFHFFALLNGAVGTTPGGFFVWGIDRGAGTERFVTGTPSIGDGVFFDSVVIVTPSSSGGAPTGSINLFKLGGPGGAITMPISIVGDTIDFDIAASLLPSQGRALADYGWNLWPRDGAGNAHVSDFAPDASTPRVAAVPIPPTAWLLALGGGRPPSRRDVDGPPGRHDRIGRPSVTAS